MVKYSTFFRCLIYSLALVLAPSVNAEPMVQIDRSVIAVDDTVTFTIRIDKTGSFSGPDLNPLKNDFHVLGNSKNSRHVIRNGRSESWTEWRITLMPKRTGRLTIAAISVAGETTEPITINVQRSIPRSSGQLSPVFLESEVSANSVYVQQQIILTVRIFQSIQMENMNVSEPEFDNAAVKNLGQTSFQRRVQNTPYRVHELRYAIFPQESGELIIPELVFSASQTVARRSMFSLPGQGKPIRKTSQQHRIIVKQPPQQFDGKTWLPAQSLKLMETWSSSPGNIRVGESITRTITVRADGLLDSQLPPFEIPEIAGAKLYPDQGKTETANTEVGVRSSRADSAAIIATREGELVLPEVRLSWWDTESNSLQEAVIPASTLTIKPSLATAHSASTPLAVDHSLKLETTTRTPPVAQNHGQHWQWVSALLLILWAATLILWWRMKLQVQAFRDLSLPATETQQPIKSNEKKAFKELKTLCRSNDVQGVRSAIIRWAQYFWEDQSIQSVQDIQSASDHPSLGTALQQLDNHLYGNKRDSSDWNGESLLSVITLVRDKTNKRQTVKAHGLPSLYSS